MAGEPDLLSVIQQRLGDPQNLALRDLEHELLVRYLVQTYGPLGMLLGLTATPAYSGLKMGAQALPDPLREVVTQYSPIPLTQEAGATPGSLREIGAGLRGLFPRMEEGIHFGPGFLGIPPTPDPHLPGGPGPGPLEILPFPSWPVPAQPEGPTYEPLGVPMPLPARPEWDVREVEEQA